MEIGNLINIEHLDIFENLLFGEIPATLKSCVKLEFLAMRRNFFQGDVPSSLESLKGLEHFDLSDNKFFGKIPKFLESFDFLQLLNLSYNDCRGAKKFPFRQMRFMLGWGSKSKLDNGLDAWPKGYGEDPKNSLYFMPWA